ncbi:nuclear transport factor 2 family protein [Nocardioides sp. cx-173]|uniref:nuclear transport factor 2 family protein n=1 Tax=Nocardioides sp. cx-173 TaxID=2898796 RepID=UPI001E5A4E6C|nr:nuclear transport factor 2 family protein [Nocardioides sp. cx-173]MCD4524209.1 nuclear transport factor 2 family protein [Nocardioides sp. cx-173]UGB41601.1 nuclear transport factor 2 family protein [Nocardioides sp. cx-173]
MTTLDLAEIAVVGAQLQSAYALAIDTRDWGYFATLFTPDVRATYPTRSYHGMEDWLSSFIPFHDECTWTLHMMSNHVVGVDDDGIWAACYGAVQWCHESEPDEISRAWVHFRDRLVNRNGQWLIARRKLDVLMHQRECLMANVSFPRTVVELADRSATAATS